jgi:alkyldihydroxyacetonephosphate synthase
MRRWNGWGDDAIDAALPSAAAELLTQLVGPGTRPHDATLREVVAAASPTRLTDAATLDVGPEARVRHARGQSLPDWIALRSGRLGRLPDAVAHPVDAAAVRGVLGLARAAGATLVPHGGGTSVVGGVDIGPGDAPVITVALDRLAGLTAIDERSGLATFGAGTTGPAVEAALADHGLTLGHYPQSWEHSTVGGWVVTRSSGQQSVGYGRIEALFAGGHLETPAGPLDLPTFPASAAGPDVRQLVLGSEGRAGILTDVVVRATPTPATERFDAFVVADWGRAMELARSLARSRLPISMVRASTPLETATAFAMSSNPGGVRWLKRYLALRGQDVGRCLVIVALTGTRSAVASAAGEVARIVRGQGGVGAPMVGHTWHKERFAAPYLRNTLWEAGYAVDTLETAADWTRIGPLAAALGPALRHGLHDLDERVHAFTHLSHVYPSGSSLYTTYVFRLADDPDDTLDRWRRLKTAASGVIVAHGGTITHQHGIGRDHAPYLAAEKGPLGMAATSAALHALDPDGVMSPGVLLQEAPA